MHSQMLWQTRKKIKNKNKWLIFDVLLNGSISEIATKKSEFHETLNNGGITSLISLIDKNLGFVD